MPILLILWKFKYLIAIAVFFFLWVGQIAYTNHLSGKLKDAETVCDARVAKAIKPYEDAEKKSQEKTNEVSEEYETTKEAERVRTEYITRDVQKIVERPIYINNCFDTDGVSAVNQAAGISHTSEP